MLPTLTTKQAMALAIAAPGTVAIREDSGVTLKALVSTDDRYRSGIVMLEIDPEGHVTYHLTDCRQFTEPFSVLLAQHREAEAERIAGI